MKKLIKSPFFDLFCHDLTSDEEEDVSTKVLEAPTMLLEEGTVANALCTAFDCKHCKSELCKGFCMYPTLVCEPIFLQVLVRVIGMLLTFDLLLLK